MIDPIQSSQQTEEKDEVSINTTTSKNVVENQTLTAQIVDLTQSLAKQTLKETNDFKAAEKSTPKSEEASTS